MLSEGVLFVKVDPAKCFHRSPGLFIFEYT